MLIQLYGTDEFGFDQAANAYLMAGNALVRGVFLMSIFPTIITSGRKWFSSRSQPEEEPLLADESLIPDNVTVVAPTPEEPRLVTNDVADNGKLQDESNGEFDLFFLRWSLVVDALVTAGIALSTKGWHLFLGRHDLHPSPASIMTTC
jgi:hypothetical protein